MSAFHAMTGVQIPIAASIIPTFFFMRLLKSGIGCTCLQQIRRRDVFQGAVHGFHAIDRELAVERSSAS